MGLPGQKLVLLVVGRMYYRLWRKVRILRSPATNPLQQIVDFAFVAFRDDWTATCLFVWEKVGIPHHRRSRYLATNPFERTVKLAHELEFAREKLGQPL